MASFVATTYPTRKPANPYALENVLNKMHYQSVLVVLMYQDNLSAVTNSKYASSIKTGT